MNKRNFNTINFKSTFTNLVNDINTINPSYKKEGIKNLNLLLDRYLCNEIYYGNIIKFDLKIERIGQSKVKCILEYIEYYSSQPTIIILEERMKKPSEIRKILFSTLKNSLILKDLQKIR